MSEYLIKSATLTGIADAIREKKSSTDPIPVLNMRDEILALSGDTSSTLPPPVGAVYATGGDQSIEVSFEAVPEEYEEYLGEVAYVVVVKAEGIPESPTDGIVVKLDKNGAVIG